jgi:DNA-binding response OmpR family regulator
VSDLTEPLRVLYADDRPGNFRLMREVVAVVLKPPHLLATARSAEQVLALAEEIPFDVIVVDQDVPGMSGVELLRRARERWPGIGRVMVTSHPQDQEVVAACRAGAAQCVLVRPWSPREMEAALRALLSARPPRP